MRVLVTGGTGAIGSHLVPALVAADHEVLLLTRSPERRPEGLPEGVRLLGWDAETGEGWADQLPDCDAVIHLAGRGLFDRRWSDAFKEELRRSRVETTALLARLLAETPSGPRILVSASAVGFYGDTGARAVDESAPPGDDFLARLCVDWEAAADPARNAGVRVAHPRLGIVLQRDGGALARMLPAFRFFVGGTFGAGEGYFPWIHVDDVVAALLRPLEDPELAGPYNAVAPEELTLAEFSRRLARRLSRPCWRIPELALRLALGEAADFLTASLRVRPERLLGSGFRFRHGTLDAAFADLVG